MTFLWNETDLIQATGGALSIHQAIHGTGVSIDTRTLRPGDIFIAIKGENSDGHDYIQQALANGASCVIVTHIPSQFNSQLPFLIVSDTLHALTKMGIYARQRFHGKAIAITGSVGKTTTKEMLKNALQPFGKIHAAEGSYNNHLGVPLTLARLPSDADYCISEIGMNHSGEIAPLAAMVKPDIAIITTVSSSHLGLMKTLDAIAEEKSQIITALSKNGILILPETVYDFTLFEKRAMQYHVHLYRTGLSEKADFQIQSINLGADYSIFKFKTVNEIFSVSLASPGQHLIHDASLVLGAVFSLKLDLQQAITALHQFTAGSGRGEILPLIDKTGILLDESYNASTLSIQAALKTLTLLSPKRRIAVLGDIFELDEYSEKEHLSLIPSIIQNSDLVFTCGSSMKIVFDQLPRPIQGKWCKNAEELIPFIHQQLQDRDTVLVKGSHGMHMEKIVRALTQKMNQRKN